MNVKSIKSLVSAALNAAHAYGKGVTELKAVPEVASAARKGADAVRVVLLPHVAAYYGVPVVVSESNRNKGAQSLDREAAGYEAAKKALQRLTADVIGPKGQKEEIEIPAEVLAAAARLAKLANQYEGARSLASRALAAAFAA